MSWRYFDFVHLELIKNHRLEISEEMTCVRINEFSLDVLSQKFTAGDRDLVTNGIEGYFLSQIEFHYQIKVNL